MKICVIGAGSTYTPELVNGFLARGGTFPLSEIWLQDINPERLQVVGGFITRLVAAHGSPFTVHLSLDQRQAIKGANYVITQLRVGMMEARRSDEYLGKNHGLIGQETTGVGGMAKALRTIPVILQIAELMQELAAPGALLVNFTNPSGLVTQALSQYAPQVPVVGVCNVAVHTQMEFGEILAQQMGTPVDLKRTYLDTLGLNHLTWHRGFRLDGEDVWPQILDGYLQQLEGQPEPEWDPQIIRTLGMIPNYYLHYFYNTARKLAEQEDWPPSRAEQVMQIETSLLQDYANKTISEPPPGLMQRGGAYYSTTAAQLLDAHYNDLGTTQVVNVPHNGTVAGWPQHWVLEMPCRIDRNGIHPLPATPLPDVCFGLLAQVKAYELLTVEAAVHGDRNAAYQALMAHPLGPDAWQIPALLEDMLVRYRPYLPQFWGKP